MASVGTAYVNFQGNFSALTSGLASALAPGVMRKKGMLAGGALVGGVVVAAAGLAKSIKLADEFQQQMTLVHTQAGASAKEVKNLSNKVLDLAKAHSEFSPNELAQGLFRVESAGFHGARAMDVLRNASHLAAVGQADLEDTTHALTGTLRTGIKGSKDLGKTVGSLNAIIGAGSLRMDDLNSAIGTGFFSNARQLGLSLNQAGAALATVTRQGQPATAAATRLSMAFRKLVHPTDQGASSLAAIGVDSEKLARLMEAHKFPEAIGILVDHLNALGDNPAGKAKAAAVISDLFGARSASGITTIIQGLDQYNKTLTQVEDKQKTFPESLKAQQETLHGQWLSLTNQIKSVEVEIGTKAIPVLTKFLKILTDPKLSAGQKFGKFFSELAHQAGIAGEKALSAFVNGFFSADLFGKILLGGLAGRLFFGKGFWGKAGGTAGKTWVLAFLAAALAIELGKTLVDAWNGQMLDQTKSEALSKDIGESLGGFAKFTSIGRKGVTVGTQIGRLIFDPNTGRVINASTKKLRTLIGKSADEVQQSLTAFGDKGGDKGGKGGGAGGAGITDRWGNALDELTKLTHSKLGKLIGFTKVDVANITDTVRAGTDWKEAIHKNLDAYIGSILNAVRKGKIGVVKGQREINQVLQAEAAMLGTGVVITAHATPKSQKGNAPVSGKGLGAMQGAWLVPGLGSGDTVPLHIGGRLAAMVEPTEQVSVLNKTATAALMGFNSQVPRMKGGGLPSFSSGDGAGLSTISAAADNLMVAAARRILKQARRSVGGGNVGGLTANANRMNALHQPYVWGGGHGATASRNGPWDCSGAVSELIQPLVPGFAPVVAASFMSMFQPGPGSMQINASSDHVFATVGGKGFGTSPENPGGGAGWLSYATRPGFAVRHIPVTGGVGKKAGKHSSKGDQQSKKHGLRFGGIVKRLKGGGPLTDPRLNQAWARQTGGGGPQLQPWVIAALAEAAGLPGTTFSQVAHGESNYRPGAVSSDGGFGLFQMTPSQWPSLVPRMQAIGSWFNPWANARMAKVLYDDPANGGMKPWHGTRFVTGPNQHYSGKQFDPAKLGGAAGKGSGGAKLTKGQQNKIKGLGLPPKVQRSVDNLTSLTDYYGGLADRASQLGSTVAGDGKTLDQVGWLKAELEQLLKLRNALITAHNALAKAVAKLSKMLKGVKGKDARKAIQAQINSNTSKDGDILSSLVDVQGPRGPMGLLGSLPAVGVLGGSIFDTQMAIRDAGSNDTSAEDSGALDAQKAINTQLATAFAVSQSQYPILSQIPNLIGAFAGGRATGPGGWALLGERGPELAKLAAGSPVRTAGETADALSPDVNVVINGHVLPFEDQVGQLVQVYVNGILQKEQSRARRR